MSYSITTQKALRASFWQSQPIGLKQGNKRQNDYPADVRMAWCDFVEWMNRSGHISDSLANRATL